MADIKLSIDDLPPATTVYGADVFVIDQLGGDGYTKKITYNNLRTTLSDTFVLKAGDTMTGALILNTSTPVSALQATSKGYVDAQVVTKVSKAGDTMTGPLTLNSNAPTAALHAASRGYVQNNFIPISGIGTGEQNTGMTGFLTLCAHPVSAFHAATKFYVDNNTGDGSPVGSIVYFAASAAPIGWFACSGAALNTTIFQDLFNVIGYTFGGSGDTFNLPDLRGEFLRGWDSSRGIDAGRIFGSSQSDDFKSHTHTASLYRGRFYTNIGNGPNWSGDVYGNNQTWPYVQVDATGGTETRPRNIALLPCIKYATSAAVNYLGLSAQSLLNSLPDSRSVAKAWVRFAGNSSSGAATIYSSYNVSAVENIATGDFKITWADDIFANDNYCVVATVHLSGFGTDGKNNGVPKIASPYKITQTQVWIESDNTENAINQAVQSVSVVVYDD
jgi:hypothetical protein